MSTLRIMIRHEGPSINCYFPTTTKGNGDPVLIASMLTAVADLHPQTFEAFREFATLLARTLLEGVGAEIERIETEQAPEHERAGHA